LGAFSVLPFAAQAQSIGVIGGDRDEPIVVVTANRAPVRIDQVGQSVTILTRQAIEASQALGATELLAQTPGVQFSRNGGRGASTSLYIRGAETGQTVVLYDGVRLQDPSLTDSGASLSDITTGSIGRIEVLRGAQSTLYGSQAIGGVINLTSVQPEDPFEADLHIEVGGLASYLVTGGAGGRKGRLTWRAGAGYTTTAGVSAYAPGVERDGYENLSLNGRLDYAFSDAAGLDLRSFYTRGEAEFDGFNADALNRGKTESWLNYAGLNLTLFDRLKNRVAYARTDIARVNFDDTPARQLQPVTFDALGRTDRFEYQGTLNIAAGSLAVFGAEHAENEMRIASPSFADPNPRPLHASDSTTGVYGQLTIMPVDGLTLTGGIRQEDHSTFGGSTVGSASLAWTPNDGATLLRASWGEGFKAPSLYQLRSEYGNTALAAEEAESWDVSIEQHLSRALALSATYFHRESRQLIVFTYCSGDAANALCADGRFGFYDNIGRVEARGVELGASVDLGPLTASANYTYLDARNTSPGDFNRGNRLARRAADTFNATASYLWPIGLVTAASVRIAGDSFNDTGNSQKIDGYILADLRASYPVSDTVEVYGRVENLFDEDYEMISAYGTLPRVIYAGARLRF
jgi:vitamin B12 transporter